MQKKEKKNFFPKDSSRVMNETIRLIKFIILPFRFHCFISYSNIVVQWDKMKCRNEKENR